MEAYNIIGRSHDCGNKLGYIQTFIEYAMRNEKLAGPLNKFLKTMIKEKPSQSDE